MNRAGSFQKLPAFSIFAVVVIHHPVQ
jgi:hypothetical protein